MAHLTERIAAGQATRADVDLLYDVASEMKGKCLCALGEFSIEAVMSGIDRFRVDFDRLEALPSPEQAVSAVGSQASAQVARPLADGADS